MADSGASVGGRKFEGPGGTPGGLGEALAGLTMIAVGIYIVFSHVTVHTSFWRFFGTPDAVRTCSFRPLRD